MSLTEYDVSYAIKEFLLSNGYTIITWNPPGSQGTFTIPNPAKDPNYKGQTGSESPDVIAFKNNELLILEAKDSYTKCISDIEKINNLLGNQARKELLFNICNKQMEALGENFDAYNCNISIGIAIPVTDKYKEILEKYPTTKLYLVSSKTKNWDNSVIVNPANVKDQFNIVLKTI